MKFLLKYFNSSIASFFSSSQLQDKDNKRCFKLFQPLLSLYCAFLLVSHSQAGNNRQTSSSSSSSSHTSYQVFLLTLFIARYISSSVNYSLQFHFFTTSLCEDTLPVLSIYQLFTCARCHFICKVNLSCAQCHSHYEILWTHFCFECQCWWCFSRHFPHHQRH